MNYEIIVVGGGHAGIEASLAAARMGKKTLLITILAEQIGAASCNPAIGGLAKGHLVKEIEVFEVSLKNPSLDGELLRHIDRAVPYHIVFILEYQGRYKACISYKEITLSGNMAFKVNSYYYTDWLDRQNLHLKLEGLNLDIAYENFVRQIAGETLQKIASDESLKDSVARSEQKELLQRQILALESKIRKEKQLNRQIEINLELKKLRKEFKNIS